MKEAEHLISQIPPVIKVADTEVERRIKEADAKFKRWQSFFKSLSTVYKDLSVHSIASLIIIGFGLTSVLIVLNPNPNQEDKSWARTTLTSIGTGVIGFLFGKDAEKRSSGRKDDD